MKGNKTLLLFLTTLCVLVSLWLGGCAKKPAEERPAKEEPNPPVAEQAGYAGSEKCQGCHGEIYDGWENNLHRKMVQDAKQAGVIIGNFSKTGNPFETAKDFKKEDIVYTIGSQWKQRYVVKKDDNFLILPAEWIIETSSWQPYHADDWNQEHRHWEDICIACHTTGYQKELGAKINEAGIGCEACHGPGAKHASNTQEKIINPAKLSYKQKIETCGQCHVRGPEEKGVREDALGYIPGGDFAKFMKPLTPSQEELAKEKPAFFPDGASKKHHQQYNDFIQSKHYAKEAASCDYCHAPHESKGPKGEIPLKRPVDQLCESCHKEGQVAANVKLQKPYLDNYMPKRAKSATEADIRSHTFKPDQTKAAVPKAPYVE
ncbi:MAG: hypothetical protein CVU89_10435 [Firmicutes bacterium HGW-Firmicutes-14]|nr:MAG: hypothetical protein CVU89_10435 [Firmicutes bacterium HGW-Firmicutes-14]